MTNKARGEVALELGGETINACATMGALARVEGRLGKSLPFILGDVSEGSYGAIVAILEECALTADDRAKVSKLVAGPVEIAEAAVAVFEAAGLIDTGKKPGK
jgi:hypothetical protein